ncbi:MAG: hypothetical protein VBE63_21895 [Lamprobacter sp.]|uniref:hypothetical protein n=1 Tax=Lamprobacter sp. TaxID=3100796 RepID=UPI002B25D08D|nr:hypothetical protein [Lamprobacter sp.]MEA3642570.1 hypothetical protein [Lamprobacter sp.]
MANDALKTKIQSMTKLAAQRVAESPYWFDINHKRRYVRVNGKSYRAVSLDPANPCGSLIRDGKKVSGNKTLKLALLDAADPQCENHVPKNKKPEHRIQAVLIWTALTDPQGLPRAIGIADRFDAIWFVADEVKMDKIRADLIMLGESQGRYVPIFIELKYKRETQVGEQVKNASEMARTIEAEFCQFLSAATKKPAEAIEMTKPLLIAIWGKSDRERPEAQAMRDRYGLLTIHHEELNL